MTISEVYNEISDITRKLIENGLSVKENWPDRNNHTIIWKNKSDISIALKKIPYEDKYKEMSSCNNYNLKMLDGALVQFLYKFNNTDRKLISHRLAYFPSPSLPSFDVVPEEYENIYYGDSEYHDIIERKVISFPIRFDFNTDPTQFKEIEHPLSHVTFGEYEFCRIPANAPLSPKIFINFILRNFYNYIYRKKGEIIDIPSLRFNNTITDKEKKILHFNIE